MHLATLVRYGLLCLLLLLTGAGTTALVGCGGGDDEAEGESNNTANASTGAPGGAAGGRGGMRGRSFGPATPVEVAPVRQGTIPRLLRSNGRLEATTEGAISARVQGQVIRVLADIGDRVAQGQVVAEFESSDYEYEFELATIELERREQELQRSQVALEKANLDWNRAHNPTDFPERNFDPALYTLDEYESLRVARRDAEIAVELARLNLRDAELAHAQAERDLADCTVVAPVDAIITSRAVNRFDRIGGEGTELFRFADLNDLELRIRLTEGEAATIAPGQPAIVVSRGRQPISYPAMLDRLTPTINPEDGVVEAIVSILPWRRVQAMHLYGRMEQLRNLTRGPIPGIVPSFPILAFGATPPLKPGMFVAVEVTTAVHRNATICPKAAVQYEGDRAYAFVVGEDGIARRVNLRLQPEFANADGVEVIGALRPGDAVVIRQADLRDGSNVRITNPEAMRGFGPVPSPISRPAGSARGGAPTGR